MHVNFFARLAALGMAAIVGTLGGCSTTPPAPAAVIAEMPDELDGASRGEWWAKPFDRRERPRWTAFLDVPRDETIGFALYTHGKDVLKMSAQLYPLKPGESRQVRLELDRGNGWQIAATAEVFELGWSAHFRIENWDSGQTVPYRVTHGTSEFEGVVRADPAEKNTVVVGLLSCDSNRDRRSREDIVRMIEHHDPDVLFFVGDQVYDHKQHTAAWLQWGTRYREVLADRPVITIPDDHDVGHGNLWGESGAAPIKEAASDTSGYFMHPDYVNMVQRCQTWHLPDAHDPTPVDRDITVYYTSINVGGVGFAILEDRKFKDGPDRHLPKMGPRFDHVTDPNYDRSTIDLPGLKLLGDRQIDFLNDWSEDWSGQQMKAVVSQTGFCGGVHLHGTFDNRLLADLDSNGWPQKARNRALRTIRKAGAVHLAGDQHLSTVLQHGIDTHRDGPFAFVGPAAVNTYYQRWWWPEDQKPGVDPITTSPLPWTGDYEDGLGNLITMHAYGNPMPIAKQVRINPETDQTPGRYGDGLGIVRFNKSQQTITFEAWPRWTDPSDPEAKQLQGWPITINASENDGRTPTGYLPPVRSPRGGPFVVQVIDDSSGEVLYTRRVRSTNQGAGFRPPVFGPGPFTVRVGADRPTATVMTNAMPASKY